MRERLLRGNRFKRTQTRHYVVLIERAPAKEDSDQSKLKTYLCRGKEVSDIEDATHFVSPGHAYAALEVYGAKIVRKSVPDRKAMFMDVVDRSEKLSIDRKAKIAGAVANILATPIPSPDALTPRELDVALLRIGGMKPAQIAADLGLSVKTVSTYQLRIKEKLDLPNLHAALAMYALRTWMQQEKEAV